LAAVKDEVRSSLKKSLICFQFIQHYLEIPEFAGEWEVFIQDQTFHSGTRARLNCMSAMAATYDLMELDSGFTKVRQEIQDVNGLLREQLVSRLAKSKNKEVVMFIHGYNNKFDDAQFTIAGLWHLLGRKGIALTYSWPAAHGGLFGYFIDRESGEYTIYHLKETLRLLFSIPEIERIHLIAHSRGTDVTTSALRELMIEERAKGNVVSKRFRIENLMLAAPDLDFGVISQRLMAEQFATAIGRCYI
jgi:esterase/lipase superfamily enzyme